MREFFLSFNFFNTPQVTDDQSFTTSFHSIKHLIALNRLLIASFVFLILAVVELTQIRAH